MVTKKEIEMARERYWLKEAQKQLGSHITSLKQVKIVTPARIPRFSLGESLVRTAKRRKLSR